MKRTTAAFLGILCLLSCDRPPIDWGPSSVGRDVPSSSHDGSSSPDASDEPGSVCGDYPWPSGQSHSTDERVAPILSSMSLDEKIEQMAGHPPGTESFATPDNERLDVRGFRFRDGPRGVRLEDGNATCFPVSVCRGASWDLDLEERVGAAMGEETRGLGYNLLLAPTINTLRHPAHGRAQESYGEDPWLLGKFGIAMTRGIQSQVAACPKHYAGNNIEDTRMTNNALIDGQNLRENYTRQFEMVVREADPACVMAAYNQVNGAYCCEHEHLLRDILKGDREFDGFVLSDWFATRTTVGSALAGLDVEMPWRQHYWTLQQAVSSGGVDEELIDDAVERILRIKFRYDFAMLDEVWEGNPDAVESSEHIALALEAAQKGIVLLKNEDQTLPLDRGSLTRIAVLGPWANEARLGDTGSSNVSPSYAVTPYAGIADRAGDGLEVVTSVDASAAIGADIAIVVVAMSQEDEGEATLGGGDRAGLDISEDQEALVREVAEIAPRTIVVMEAGGPITMENWKEHADAIVMAWYPGMEGGHALGDLLFGDVEFTGRTVQTWPVREEDEPEFGNRLSETLFEYLHGYRHFDDNNIKPLFPFGFGLGYTSFEYSNLVVPCSAVTPGARMVITVDVENTGARPGVEVPQAYVAYPNTSARRPRKELKGFARMTLEPGEKRTVEIPIRIPDLAYFDVERNAWSVEMVEHEIFVGPHAGDLPLSASFTIASEGEEVDR